MIYIAFIFFTFLIILFALYQWQHFAMFTPVYFRDSEIDEVNCEVGDDRYEMLSITTDDGNELEGVIYEPSDAKSTLLFFAGRSHDSVGLIQKLSDVYKQSRIITFNYRSYGLSEGQASEKNILNDGVKIARLVQKNYGDFYILGFSLGASVGAYVASRHKTLGLFLIGAFDSIESMAKEKYKINIPFLVRYKFDNSSFVKEIEYPTYLFASKSDEMTYIQNTRKLKQSVKNLAFYKELDNLSHKELLWDKNMTDEINGVIS